jgi:hypothetical protein
MSEIVLTKPESELSYAGQYPDMTEFEKPWESAIRVNQGSGDVSYDGTPLQSEGFSKCIALLLRNETNLDSAMFHIDDLDLGGWDGSQIKVMREYMNRYISSFDMPRKEKEDILVANHDVTTYSYPRSMSRETFKKKMEELNSDTEIKAAFVVGTNGRGFVADRVRGSLLNYLGIDAGDNINVDTGHFHWANVYKPNESNIYVQSKSLEKVLIFRF